MKIGPVHRAILTLLFTSLSGCAGIEADVHASAVAGAPLATRQAAGQQQGQPDHGVQPAPQATQPPSAALPGAQTYRLARTPSQDSAAEHPRCKALVRDALARYGLTDTETDGAHYVLSIAYASRPATVEVQTGACASATTNDQPGGARTGCSTPPAPGIAWFGRQAYRHALSLRFFDVASGAEVYKVSAVTEDHDADPAHALPSLVTSALAKFPFAQAGNWRVKLLADDPAPATTRGGASPRVVSVTPVANP